MAEKKEKQYLSDNAQLMAEWDWEKNNELGLDPHTLTCGSGKKVWWKCSNGHQWNADIHNRSAGNGCPVCSGRCVFSGVNDLATANPILAKEWNHSLNGTLTPHNVLPNSNKKVWWKCISGHEWQATIASRNSGCGCPYCSGRLVIKGANDIQTTHSELLKEWNYKKNLDIHPTELSAGSDKKVWWICPQRHEWQATIASRSSGKACPYCSGRLAIKGLNDIQTTHPGLLKEWDYGKNLDKQPDEISSGSDKKVWWICSQGHKWQAPIYNRTIGHGCPYCCNQLIAKGYNDLATTHPQLTTEWDFSKNKDISPELITSGSDKKVWWICKKGHSWQGRIADRSKGRGCPICSSGLRTSFPEYALIYYLQKCGIDVIQSYNKLGYELDVYVPSLKIAIEYDGYFYHKDKTNNDLEKNKRCHLDGIKLYRIREELRPLNDTSLDFVVKDSLVDLSKILRLVIFDITNTYMDIDVKRDFIAIENLREHLEKENSLYFVNPNLAAEWNYGRNGRLLPEHVTANSGKSVWWKCKNGHEWQASIARRNNGTGCPYCSGRLVISGVNDLCTINPELANEWNYVKNAYLRPEHVKSNSGKKVWWICPSGHEWLARIDHRNNGSGCPECAKQLRKKKDT